MNLSQSCRQACKKVFQSVWNAPTGAHAHQIKTLQRQVMQLVDELSTTRVLYARECERTKAAEKFIVDATKTAEKFIVDASQVVESVALPRPYAGETVGQYSEYVYASQARLADSLNRPAVPSAASSADDNESAASR